MASGFVEKRQQGKDRRSVGKQGIPWTKTGNPWIEVSIMCLLGESLAV